MRGDLTLRSWDGWMFRCAAPGIDRDSTLFYFTRSFAEETRSFAELGKKTAFYFKHIIKPSDK